ncbi:MULTISPECIES: CapA family protein [unclassified Mesorhizobium]|uniref:CapA family protein n=1 Tax=unclassified Mesorhizobium TaxID=325217 RepID=UPI000FDCA019|nr:MULTISPECIES: CapA family protein [unclassified Mesorhizobium]TGR23004.1 CapA family protein [Mesorhizobium sp. M8A.F.Ca.ET.197.01.1.1]TGR39089.1 CapA family protein [bacterium M00.F.Ca.ET.199.01.1.1]TGR46683.1 CapA family protein [Mesorhizobium sp. M8A.F.Ca.ET.198.01.1.1]TGV85243.1 CapA family protein [Mesorhizobium sp. M00.F.Ca.ET.149.01.1.1]
MSEISIVVTGDVIAGRPFSKNPTSNLQRFAEVLRATDVAITNLEIVAPGEERHPSTLFHGIPLYADAAILDELRWIGFNLYGVANNHALDYGVDGLRTTMDELDRRGMPFAGVGRTLSQARAPRYFEAKGKRIALIAAGTTHARFAMAADPTNGDKGRIGIAPVRIDRVHYIEQARFEEFRSTLKRSGVNVRLEEPNSKRMYFPYPDRAIFRPAPAGGFAVEGVHFVPSDDPRVEMVALESDVKALLESVTEATKNADFVIVSLHSHEGAGGAWNGETLPEFLKPLSYRLIDAGAGAVVNHGPHTLRGIEIYKHRPICYSLSNIIYRQDTVEAFPAEFYEQVGLRTDSTPAEMAALMSSFTDDPHLWDTIAVRFVYENDAVSSVEIVPVDLNDANEPPGLPKLATGEAATRILETMIRLSKPFGTEIQVVNGADGQTLGRVNLHT